MRLLIVFVAAVVAVPMASGRELNVLGGVIGTTGDAEGSYSGQVEYLDNPLRNVAFSVSYLNEGHLPHTRRDGYLAQMWAYLPRDEGRFSFAAGAGPYYFFNTTNEECGGNYCNPHGLGLITSVALGMEAANGILFHLRTNWVATPKADTLSALVGVGYRFHGENREKGPSRKDNQISFLLGQTTVNSLSSEHSAAFSLEYRRSLFENLDWTIAWLHEGDTHIIRRSGLVSQLWAVQPLLNRSLTVGIGGGLYVAGDNYHTGRDTEPLSGVVALTVAYSVTCDWLVRSTWYRVITGYDGDTDVIMGGIGFRF